MSTKSKRRVYARVGEKPSDGKCPFVRFNPNQPLTDGAYQKLRALITEELAAGLQPDKGRKRHSGGATASASVGFYLGSDGRESLVPVVLCRSETFDQGGLLQDNLRSSLEVALQKAHGAVS